MSFVPGKHKTMCIAFPDEENYQICMSDPTKFRSHLDHTYRRHPELFPEAFKGGYSLHGFVYSKKQDIKTRRIKLVEDNEAYQIRPSFLLPYMIARTDHVEKGLYFKRWGVPFEALAYAFGRYGMFWYRVYVSLGRNSLVGTTVKAADKLPQNVLADEKHSRLHGQKVYIPTTVAQECILGVDIADDAGTKALTVGYQTFKTESQQLDPTYSPHTVNTDGWSATQNAWQALFPQITLILCFLHAFLKIKDRCRSCPHLLKTIGQHVWSAYHAPTKAHFSQRIRRLREWGQHHLTGSVQEKLLALCHKAPHFKIAFDFPTAYRTSNALDRLMNYQNRLLYAMQYLHGTKASARLYLRAMALLWNFHPYGPQTQAKYDGKQNSPFEGLNGFRYHPNWLHNLLIASSLQGQSCQTQKPL
jgi:hypothetical protein